MITRLRCIDSNQQTVNQPVSLCKVIDMSELVDKRRRAKTKNNNKGLHTAQGQPSRWSGSGCSDSTAGARDALQTERTRLIVSLFLFAALGLVSGHRGLTGASMGGRACLGVSTSAPRIGAGVSLSRLCFQPVTDKRDGTQGGVCTCMCVCAHLELGK